MNTIPTLPVPTIYIFFGSNDEMRTWAIVNSVNINYVVPANQPNKLIGRRGIPRKVYGSTWSEYEILKCDMELESSYLSLRKLYEGV